MENDNVTSVMGKAVLTIRQQGDSLIAVLDAPPRDDGTPTPQQTIGGHDGAEGAVFVAKSQAKVNINGEMSSVDMIVTWTLKANGDALSGTVFCEMLGGPATLVPTPVTGSRAK